MTTHYYRLFLKLCFVIWLTTLSLPAWATDARKPILEMIPKQAHAFIVVNNLKQADQAIFTLAAKAKMPLPGVNTLFKKASGIYSDIDKEGSIAVLFCELSKEAQEAAGNQPNDETTSNTDKETEEIFLAIEDEESDGDVDEAETNEASSETKMPLHTVFLLPVSDFKKFSATFQKSEKVKDSIYKAEVDSKPIFFAYQNGYVALTFEANHDFFDLVLGAKGNIKEEIQPWKEWIDQQVLYAFVTHSYFEKLEEAGHANFKIGIGSDGFVAEKTKKNESESDKVTPDESNLDKSTPSEEKVTSKDSLSPKDFNFMAAGVQLDELGMIRLTFRAGLKPGTWLAQQYSKIEPLSDNLLASLPQGPFVLAGNGDFSEAIAKCFGVIQGTASTAADGEKKIGEFLPNRCFFIGPPREEQTALENICTVNLATDTEDAFDCIKKDIEAVQNWSQGILERVNRFFGDNDPDEEDDNKDGSEEQDQKDFGSLCKVLTRKTTIEDCKSLIVTYDLSQVFQKAEEDMGGIGGALMKSTFENVYGTDFKIDEYHVLVKENRILSTYCRDPGMRKQLIEVAKAQAGGLADDESIQKVLTRLPREAQWKYLWSPHGTIKYFQWYFKVVLLPIYETYLPFDTIPEFPESSPIGIAGVASEELIEWSVIIPPDTLRNSYQYWTQLQLFFQQFQKNETF